MVSVDIKRNNNLYTRTISIFQLPRAKIFTTNQERVPTLHQEELLYNAQITNKTATASAPTYDNAQSICDDDSTCTLPGLFADSDDDFNKPIIGIANGYSTITPCNVGLNDLAQRAEELNLDAEFLGQVDEQLKRFKLEVAHRKMKEEEDRLEAEQRALAKKKKAKWNS